MICKFCKEKIKYPLDQYIHYLHDKCTMRIVRRVYAMQSIKSLEILTVLDDETYNQIINELMCYNTK